MEIINLRRRKSEKSSRHCNKCYFVVVCCFAALTTVVVFTGTSNNGVGNLFGYMPFSIQTQSMEPTIKAGDVVIGKEVDFNTLKEGDIITYWTTVDEQKILNTHRITKLSQTAKVQYHHLRQKVITTR